MRRSRRGPIGYCPVLAKSPEDLMNPWGKPVAILALILSLVLALGRHVGGSLWWADVEFPLRAGLPSQPGRDLQLRAFRCTLLWRGTSERLAPHRASAELQGPGP